MVLHFGYTDCTRKSYCLVCGYCSHTEFCLKGACSTLQWNYCLVCGNRATGTFISRGLLVLYDRIIILSMGIEP